jgi:hypothetical protein
MTVKRGKGTTSFEYVTVMPSIPAIGVTKAEIIEFARTLIDASDIPGNTPVVVSARKDGLLRHGSMASMYVRFRVDTGDKDEFILEEVPEVPVVPPVSGESWQPAPLTPCRNHQSYDSFCNDCFRASSPLQW